MIQLDFKFGKQVRDEVYTLEKSIALSNHGSYGAVPKSIQQKRVELIGQMESAPDIWFRSKSPKLWDENRQVLAEYLKVPSESMLLVENASDGTNAVLRSVTEHFTPNDAILAQEYTYPAALNAVDYVSKYRFKPEERLPVIKMPISYPIRSVQEILDAYDRMCQQIIEEKKLKLRLVVLDHISSATATLFPIEEIAIIIRKWEAVQETKIKIFIDGAHSIGQVDIDLNCGLFDYYVSNLHKWFLSPRGCAFLYFKDPNETYQLLPNIISHGYGKDATKNFYERATRDFTSWYVVRDCIDTFENSFGGLKSIHKYTAQLLEQAVQMLVQSWGTTKLDLPKEMEAPYMKVIKLPKLKNLEILNGVPISSYQAVLNTYLQETFNVDTQISPFQGEIYVRISAFVYSEMSDFEALRDAINHLKE